MRRFFTYCAIAYLVIYAFEGAVRYGLHLAGADNLILLRDALIFVPLLVLLVYQGFHGKMHPAFFAFAVIIALHGAISTFDFHTTLPAI